MQHGGWTKAPFLRRSLGGVRLGGSRASPRAHLYPIDKSLPMPYDQVPPKTHPALPARIDEYQFTADIHGACQTVRRARPLMISIFFSPDGGATNTKLLGLPRSGSSRGALPRRNIHDGGWSGGGVRGKRIPFAVLKRLMQTVDAAMKQASNAGN